MIEQIFYGFFEDASEIPAYEPPRDAPCPFCGTAVHAEDVRTHSMMYATASYAKRSYFYRTHRTCAERFAPLNMDGFIFDMINRNGD